MRSDNWLPARGSPVVSTFVFSSHGRLKCASCMLIRIIFHQIGNCSESWITLACWESCNSDLIFQFDHSKYPPLLSCSNSPTTDYIYVLKNNICNSTKWNYVMASQVWNHNIGVCVAIIRDAQRLQLNGPYQQWCIGWSEMSKCIFHGGFTALNLDITRYGVYT